MQKEKLLKAVKIFIITLLLMGITLLGIMKWKSDLIMDMVMSAVQEQLVDSLQYSEAGMDWFSYFPSTSIRISDLKVGSGKTPLLQGGNVDIVIRLLPLLKNKIIINRLQVMNSSIHILQKDGKWSYDILKPSDPASEKSFQTEVRQLVIETSTVHYNDGQSLSFSLDISTGTFKGGMENNKLDLDIDMTSSLSTLGMDGYNMPQAFPSILTGRYSFDMDSGQQLYKEWRIENDAIILSAGGSILRESDHEVIDMDIAWKKADPELLKQWLPEKLLQTWKQYGLSGECEGQAKIEGKASSNLSPHISSTALLKNGGIHFLEAKQEINGLDVELLYDSGGTRPGEKSSAEVVFKKSALIGSGLEGKITIENLDRPVFDISLNGSLPSGLINLLEIEGLKFDKGSLDIYTFELRRFQPEIATLSSFMEDGKVSLKADNLSFIYLNNTITVPDGELQLEDSKLNIQFDAFTWNKATVDDLNGSITAHQDKIDFTLDGTLCEGKVETTGMITGMNQRPVSTSSWKVTGIEMKSLLESFSNFDQTFITSDHLKGKANIWAEATIPFDEKWNIRTNEVLMRSAIDIRDGQLKGMKTLEDFSKYVHIDDLRDIRFNQLRNYMKIENGTVYLPVMFIQSSALNLSISGEHGFDQDILYYLKLNAGQVVSNKIKKNNVLKELKQARKSGWINMYFILRGNTSDVQYQQYRAAVIAGFEQSTALKENLRNYLVEKFGYDVYWLEPNEWEDIPEYQ